MDEQKTNTESLDGKDSKETVKEGQELEAAKQPENSALQLDRGEELVRFRTKWWQIW